MVAFLDVERQCSGCRACFVIQARMIVSGSVWATRWWTTTWSSSRPGPPEHRAGDGVRPEGVLLGGRQGAGRGDHGRRVRVHRRRSGRRDAAGVVRLEDGEAGLSARTIKRRLASCRGLFAYLGPARTPACAEPGAPGAGGAAPRRRRGCVACRWCVRRGRCRGCWPRDEVDALLGGAAHPPGPGDGRWRCCSAGCAAARCSACAWRMCTPVSGGCSSPRARAGISGSCRSRRGSSPRWPPTWTGSGPRDRD